MKKLFGRKFLGIPMAVVAIVLMVVVALAATVLTISSTVTITPYVPPPTFDIEIYSDAAGTVAITDIAWGSTAAGTDIAKTVYIKGVGTGTSEVSVSLSNAPADVTVTGGPITVAPDAVVAFDLTLVVPQTAEVGTFEAFDTVFSAAP